MEPGDINIVNFPDIPDDHRKTERHTVSGSIYLCSLGQIMADLRYDYELPDFLMQVQQDILGYEATIHVPKAGTVGYNRLREELIYQEQNAL